MKICKRDLAMVTIPAISFLAMYAWLTSWKFTLLILFMVAMSWMFATGVTNIIYRDRR